MTVISESNSLLRIDRDIEYVEWLLCSAAVTSESPKSL